MGMARPPAAAKAFNWPTHPCQPHLTTPQPSLCVDPMRAAPTDADVDLWIREPAVVLARDGSAHAPKPEAVLDPIERDRWHRFADADSARSYAAVHLLARICVGGLLGRSPSSLRFDRACDDCDQPHGRPRLVDDPTLHVSLTRTRSLVAVALSRFGPVGVDVERHSEASFPGYAEVALHPDERVQALGRRGEGHVELDVTAWVRKEAALKALGLGLRIDPAGLRTPSTGQSRAVVAGMPMVTVVDVPVADAYAVAVAVVTGSDSVRIRRH